MTASTAPEITRKCVRRCAECKTLDPQDRIFNPSRETARLLAKVAKIGPHTAQLGETLFRTLGRPGQKALYGLSNLPKTYRREDIEAVTQTALAAHCHSYASVKRALERRAAGAKPAVVALTQSAPEIRAIAEYQDFFDTHTQNTQTETAP